MNNSSASTRIQWEQVLDAARDIVESYDTKVTLRQLFYRLVAAMLIPNVTTSYKRLSALTAEARRRGDFPDLIDRTRQIHEYRSFESPQDALGWMSNIYRLDRTEGQKASVYLGVEKAGIVAQLQNWFGDLGVPIIALGGYGSQSHVDDVVRHAEDQGRPAVFLYAGDHDASGHDILRDFLARSDCWEDTRRIALSPEQVIQHNLPQAMGKPSDSRAARFVERFGQLVQVELDALPPNVLQGLFRDAIDEFWDMSAYDAVVEQETAERAALRTLANTWTQS